MGSSAIKSIAVGLILMACAVYFAPDSTRTLHKLLINVGVPDEYLKHVSFLRDSSASDGGGGSDEILLTPEQLKKYDGGPESSGLYLAILGEIFDVEKGAQHYRPGGGYAFFNGKDASRAYITGDFSEKGLVDYVSDLDAKSLASLEDWLSFYRDEYKSVGKVIGRYYNQNGEPTDELLTVKKKISSTKKNKWMEDREKEVFPPCNSEWSQEKGSRVWCTNKSGGIERSWVGVPRELHKDGRDPRCVCVRDFGSPSDQPESTAHDDRGDLDHPDLKEYEGCSPSAEACNVKHP